MWNLYETQMMQRSTQPGIYCEKYWKIQQNSASWKVGEMKKLFGSISESIYEGYGRIVYRKLEYKDIYQNSNQVFGMLHTIVMKYLECHKKY